MVRKLLLLAIIVTSGQSMAQDLELIFQIRLIKELMPDSTRFGLMYNPDRVDVEADIDRITTETGMLVVKTPVNGLREISSAIRSLIQYEVDFIYMVEDSILTSGNGIKFAVRPTKRRGIPVFSTVDGGLDDGLFGRIFQQTGYWRMYVNSESLADFNIKIPEGSEDFIRQ